MSSEWEKERKRQWQKQFGAIKDKTKTRNPAWKSFRLYMKERHYDYEAINDAWIWFRCGWAACKNSEEK